MQTIEDRDEWKGALGQVMMFQSVSEVARAAIWQMGELLYFEPEEMVVKDGDLSPSFFVILEGTVKVHVTEGDKDAYICSLGKGSNFGESALFLKMPRTANVTAVDPTVVLKLTRFDMMAFIRHNPLDGNRFLLVIIYQLMKKLREANRELAYERRDDSDQSEVDALIAEFTGA